MLCVLAVFIPSFFMQGPAQALFVPLSLAVGFAMVSSYLLSSTFVPVLSTWLLRHHGRARRELGAAIGLRPVPRRSTGGASARRPAPVAGRPRLSRRRRSLVTFGIGRQLGLEIFPRVDAGRFQLRLKAPAGTRIEKTERIASAALDAITKEVGEDGGGDLRGLCRGHPVELPDQRHLPVDRRARRRRCSGSRSARGAGVDVEALKRRLREKLAAEMPDVKFSFEPADIVSDVMSFGSPTPVEVAVSGPNFADSRAHAEKVRAELAKIPSLRDLQYAQSLDYPTVSVEIDRERAGISGVTVEEVARSLVTATSSSRFVVPNYWPDPKTGIGYQVQVEIPVAVMDSVKQVETIPIQRPGGPSLLLRDVAKVRRGTMPGEYDRYNMKRSHEPHREHRRARTWGGSRAASRRPSSGPGPPPKGVIVDVRGQVAPMREMLTGLSVGLVMSVVVILLLLTANFQSVRLALVAVSTAPAVVSGVVIALWLTGTTINIQSFMGAIMAIGVAVANAILLVTFAERRRLEDRDEAAEAAVVRVPRAGCGPS